MSLADDLLAQARALCGLESKKPKQASLRRSVSAAYYAIFHLLAGDAARLFVRDDSGLQSRVVRTLGHVEMKRASGAFLKDELPESIRPDGARYQTPGDLKVVAEAFVKSQQFRHLADYDTNEQFSRPQVEAIISDVERAFESWAKVRSTDDARLYPACFLLWDVWKKPPR